MNITWAGLLYVWTSVWAFLTAIPSSFWGVIAGSVLSLAGIRLTNKATLQRLKVQLDSDRELKAEERRMSIRRDAYLQAAEHVAFGINTLLIFGNLDRDVTSLDKDYAAKAGVFARVQAIATPELTRALLEMTHAIGEGMLSGFSQRMKLVPRIGRRDTLRALSDRMLKEQTRWLEELKSYNLAGVDDPQRLSVINRNFEYSAESFNSASTELEALGNDLLRAQLQISTVQMDAVSKCNLLAPALVKALRKELDFEYTGEEIEKLLATSIQKQRDTLAAFFKEVEAMIQPQESATTKA